MICRKEEKTDMKKILSLIIVIIIIATYAVAYSAAADAASTESFQFHIHESSIFEVFPVTIAHLETVYNKHNGVICLCYYQMNNDDGGVFNVSNEQYSHLKTGDTIIVSRRSMKEYPEKIQIVSDPKTDVFIEDIINEGKKYFAVVNNNGTRETVEVLDNYASELNVGQDVEFSENREIKGYGKSNYINKMAQSLFAGIVLFVFIVAVIILLIALSG